MQELRRLESLTYSSNGNGNIRMGSLPKGKRVRAITLWCDFSGTKGAGVDALDGDLFAQSIALIKIGEYVIIPGLELWRLMQAIKGRVAHDPTDIAAAGGTFVMQFGLEVPFRDERQPGSDDGSMPCELFTGKDIEITFASSTVWGVGTLTVTAGTVYPVIELVEETNVPQVNQIGYIDGAGGVAVLKPAVYKELHLTQAGNNVVSTAELTTVDVEADGKTIVANAMHEQLVLKWNQDAANESGGVHELTINTARFIPLIYTDQKRGNLSKQVAIEKEGKVTVLSGTLTTPRIIFWRTLFKGEAEINKVAQHIGVPEGATTYEAAVASKSPLRAAHRSQRQGKPTKKHRVLEGALAGKLRRTPTPGKKAQ